MTTLTPFACDTKIARVAEEAGFTDITRRRQVDIDRKVLPASYWLKVPDYRRITRELEDGAVIPGATLTDKFEYSLR